MSLLYITSPLEWRSVTQPYGVNLTDWYKKWGLNGHPGIDYRCETGTSLYAVCDGIIKDCGTYSDGGVYIELFSDVFEDNPNQRFKFQYLHLKDFLVKTGQS